MTIRNVMTMTQQRRRMLNDLIGIREQSGISRAQVAAELGIRARRIRRFEENPEMVDVTLDFLLRYADAVGASISMNAALAEGAR